MLLSHGKHKTGLYGIAVIAVLFSLIACSESGGGGGGNAPATIPVLDTANPSGFVAASTDAEKNQLLAEMWAILTAVTCWDASFVGDPTIGGTPASVDQYQFYDVYQYRHVGFSTTFGQLGLYDIGTYYGYTTAIVDVGGYVDAFSVVDQNTIAYFTKNPSGAPFVIYYGAADQGCL